MSIKILLAHARGEDEIASKIGQPLKAAGFEVWDHDAVQLGESITETASTLLADGAPVVMCATVKAVGTKWARMVINAARQYPSVKVFIIQMDQEADVEKISFGEQVGRYWQNPTKTLENLITVLRRQSPDTRVVDTKTVDIEKNYADILLKSCDIINLANLPETDRYRVTQQLELRKLYVALRVQLEISSEEEPSSENIGDIESRREILRRGKTQWSNFNQDLAGIHRNRFPIGERLAVGRSMVVLGDPGSGKTTLLRWIATAYLLRLKSDADWEELPDVLSLPTENWLPIFIRCRDFDQNSPPTSLEDLLRHNLRRAEIPEVEAANLVPILVKKVKDGTAILLIDGVDEITDITVRAGFCHQIEQMRLAYPDAPIVVTSRIVGYREMGQRIGRGFEHLTVAELSREDKDEFARLWCNLTEIGERRHEAAAELIREIHSTDRIERLTTNPMLLTTIALVKRKVGRLPSHRVDLYGDALTVLLNWRREVDQPLDWYEAVPQLGFIAYSMCNQGVLQLRKDEILELLQIIRTQYPSLYAIHSHTPEQFLNLLERLTGVLTQVGTVRHVGLSIPVYEFRHLTFQEYLAARALIDGCYPDRDRTKNLAETIAPLAGQLADEKESRADRDVAVSESWSETLRLCVAACRNDDIDRVIRAIAYPYPGEDSHSTKRPRAVLASLCLVDDPNVTEEVATEVIHLLINEIDHREGKEGAKTGLSTAIKELSTSRWAEILRLTLLEAFCRTNSVYRTALGSLYGVVITRGVDLKNEATRMAWVENELARLFSEERLDQVHALLSLNAVSERYQIAAPKVLIEQLLSLLTGTAPVALAAASTLETVNSNKQKLAAWRPLPQELDTILTVIEAENSDFSIVERLLRIVGREKDPRALQSVLLRLADPNLQLAAIEALGKIGGKGVAARLISFLKADDDSIKLATIKALGTLSDKNCLEPLIMLLDQGCDEIRIAAAEALGNFNEERVATALLGRVNDSNSEVRGTVLEALNKLGKSEYRDVYISKLSDNSGSVRAIAARCIGNSTDPSRIDILLPKLEDPEVEVQAAVALALGDSRDHRVVQPLIGMLSRDNDIVYLASAFALGRLRDRAATSALIMGLDSSHFMRKLAAAMALGWIGDHDAVHPLLIKLRDKREETSSIFVLALGKLKDPRVFEPVSALLKASDDSLRASAIDALGDMRNDKAIDPLFSCLNDDSSVVRSSAVSALTHFKDERILSALLAATNDPSHVVKLSAIEGLGKFHAPESVNRLIELLNDYSSSIREAAVKSLARINAKDAVPIFITRLIEENFAVKAAMIEALRSLKDIRAIKPLLKELNHNDEKVSFLANDALYWMAIDQFDEGNIEGTIEIFLAMTEVTSASSNLHNNLAFCFMLQGNYKSAKEQISLVDFEEVSDNRPLFQNNRALVTFLTGDPQKAKKQLRKALRWIDELGSEYDPHAVAAVLVLKSPEHVSSHQEVPVDVAVLINLYLIDRKSVV